MLSDGKILLGSSAEGPVMLFPSMLCRHGLIAGATGTGKTTTLKVLAEAFSEKGIPVFIADVKGDLAGCAFAGEDSEKIRERLSAPGLSGKDFRFHRFPVNFWDVYGKSGMPLRTTVSELGPLLLSRILGLTDTQSDILRLLFTIADDEGLLLIDIRDLKAMLRYVSEKRAEYSLQYGNMSPQSLAAILRAVVALETEGADLFLGEPALDIRDWLGVTEEGRGILQILDCRELFLKPRMYAMFLLWLLSELFETLPEAGNLAQPRMAFFFDEAHLLFDQAPKALQEKIEQVVRLIRSRGVGIYFITQSPSDIPDSVLAQLGNKIQHALHAYTPAEQKKLRAAAMSFRRNPSFDTQTVLEELGTGQALVSVLDEEGVPTVVQKVLIAPPESRMGTVTEEEQRLLTERSPLCGKYRENTDRDSAFEFLERRRLTLQAEKDKALAEESAEKEKKTASKKQSSLAKNAAKSGASTVGREVGKTIGGVLGGSFGKKVGGSIGASLGRGIIGTFFGSR